MKRRGSKRQSWHNKKQLSKLLLIRKTGLRGKGKKGLLHSKEQNSWLRKKQNKRRRLESLRES